METKKSLGEKIRYLRRKTKITQEQLGEKLGFSKSTIAMWESNQRVPDLSAVRKLSELFDEPVSFFVDDDNENIVTILGRNGTYKKFALNDQQLQALESFAELMSKKNE